MISSVKTHIGNVRTNNEDAFYIPPKDSLPKLFIVADGMGGHQGGEIASQMAVNTVSSYVNDNLSQDCNSQKIKDILYNAIILANKKILDTSFKNPELEGMGTTITAIIFSEKILYIAHVGDSRAYRIRNDSIEQLTRDHSLVWEMMEQGRLTIDEAKTHPMKNIITRALGTDKTVKPDIMEFDFKKDDIFVLCSDGLTNMIEDDIIKEIVCNLSPTDATLKLIEEANLNGGVDNITVAIIKAD